MTKFINITIQGVRYRKLDVRAVLEINTLLKEVELLKNEIKGLRVMGRLHLEKFRIEKFGHDDTQVLRIGKSKGFNKIVLWETPRNNKSGQPGQPGPLDAEGVDLGENPGEHFEADMSDTTVADWEDQGGQ